MSAANSLPATLTRQFDLLERRLWRTDLLVALCGGTGALLLSYAALFASDRVWDTPHWLRLGVALCGWAGFGHRHSRSYRPLSDKMAIRE